MTQLSPEVLLQASYAVIKDCKIIISDQRMKIESQQSEIKRLNSALEFEKRWNESTMDVLREELDKPKEVVFKPNEVEIGRLVREIAGHKE